MVISDVLRIKGHSVAAVLPDESIQAVVRKLADLRIGAVVVQDRWQKLVGIFSERDLVRLLVGEGKAVLDRRVGDLMTDAVITCHSADRIDSVLKVMTMHRVRHVPVVDNGALVGIVSIGDLVKHRMDEKEMEAGVLLEIARMRV
ncbi:MAG: CBS domain-containing protein [Acetobacteraceae bacterium]